MGKHWYHCLPSLVGTGLVAVCLSVHSPDISAQTGNSLVLGTPRPDGNYAGAYLRRIYTELFSRLGIPIEIRTLPTARLALELTNGNMDGDLARPLGFSESQPNLVRVDEPVLEIVYALWAVNPAIKLNKLEQLRQSSYTATFTRGVVQCEETLKSVLPEQRVVDVTTTASALNMLHYGRNELYCGVDIAALSDAGSPEFAGKAPLFKVLNIAKPDQLYMYLQRKHAALLPPINATLRKMKSDGTVERLRRESLRDFNLPHAGQP